MAKDIATDNSDNASVGGTSSVFREPSQSGLDPVTELLATLTGSSTANAATPAFYQAPETQATHKDDTNNHRYSEQNENTHNQAEKDRSGSVKGEKQADIERRLDEERKAEEERRKREEEEKAKNNAHKTGSVRDTNAKFKLDSKIDKEMQELVAERAAANGLSPVMGLALVSVENAKFNPKEQASSGASGMTQIMPKFYKDYGVNATNVWDAKTNLDATFSKRAKDIKNFEKQVGREPTAGEVYMMHQQGPGGAKILAKNPDIPAHEALRKLMYKSSKTGKMEHVYSEKGALEAISQNLPPKMRNQANTITSREFTKHYGDKIDKAYKRFSE